MRTELVVNALKMALKERSFPDRKIIHHSDRGIQYCSPEFERYTLKNDIILSNTQNSDPYENAIAERMNRTLKYEYGLKETPTRFENCSENDPASCKPLQQPSIALFTQFSNPCKSAPQRKCKT